MNAPATTGSADRIERSILINAPREKVWRALSDAESFGSWFGADLKGQTFAPQQRTLGRITICGFEHVAFDVIVERMEAPHTMSYHWHPYAIKPEVDYEQEARTLVTFTLKEAPGNATLLTVVESGFSKLPPDRYPDAFRANGRGWEAQLKNVMTHAEQA
ncbi:SRPBCC family protein [Uliginosibacterium sp. H1]|uniref:SRPBCC family protein n=1 Tax=Uliginosibacterium sp. H1 TaxID=3114757 RepID=UPI002E19E8E9|nr:SRPBCC family protein [Uliginosibacterium sp. H1]